MAKAVTSKRHCWVIERRVKDKWHPWQVCGMKAGGLRALDGEQKRNPAFEFRLEKYVSTRND